MKKLFRVLSLIFGSYFLGVSLLIGVAFTTAKYNNLEYRFELAGIAPTLIIKDTKNILIPEDYGIAGVAHGPLIFVKEDMFHNKDVITHEKTHVKQFYKVVPHVLSLFSEKYQIIAECEAYRSEDISYSDEELSFMLTLSGYNIKLSQKDILEIIK